MENSVYLIASITVSTAYIKAKMMAKLQLFCDQITALLLFPRVVFVRNAIMSSKS